MPIDWTGEIENQTITDVQVQAFSGTDQLPTDAVPPASEYVIVLGNGRTLKIAGVTLSDGSPSTLVRVTKSASIEENEVTA